MSDRVHLIKIFTTNWLIVVHLLLFMIVKAPPLIHCHNIKCWCTSNQRFTIAPVRRLRAKPSLWWNYGINSISLSQMFVIILTSTVKNPLSVIWKSGNSDLHHGDGGWPTSLYCSYLPRWVAKWAMATAGIPWIQ